MIEENAADTRKIKKLTIFKKVKGSDGSKKWEKLAKVNSKSPSVQETSATERVNGQLSNTQASIEVRLLTSDDCSSLKLACEVRLVDDTGRISTMKAVIGKKKLPSNLPEDDEEEEDACAENSPAGYFDVLGTGKKDWRLVFRGTAHNNVQVYPAYLHGTGIPADVEEGCMQFNPSLPCTNHYRNADALDNWANVDKVLLVLYVNGQKVKHIMFNGVGSTNINWFAGGKLIESSWSDLKTTRHNIFSIQGDGRARLLRRFYINHRYGGCNNDKGWFVAADAVPGACHWEKKEAAPAFLYAKGDTLAWWKFSDQVANADVMGIFVKYL
ncbi:hypothetical protein ElyMa_001789300 [Elysia marginata]|uniref:Fibrinogen C-terminal domain-containing protein n=1 Tax=Elysia marginata TaxID=1093978 RepID=A0AAV4EFZ4_9GAST|nr:hypothetical protein ElyMa_001789300 [Elysia marginata]